MYSYIHYIYNQGEDHLLVKKGYTFGSHTFNFEIEAYQFDPTKDEDGGQWYDEEKRYIRT